MFFKRRSELISVVIPNYNNLQYLQPCIDSVLWQTHKRLEVLFVDDCSTDESVDFIKELNHPKIRLIALDKNVGVARARNVGIRSATGEYLTTLDSDDLFLDRRKLEKELAQIRARRAEGDVIAFSNIVRLTESGEPEMVVGQEDIREGQIFEGMLRREIFIPRDFLCRRAVYEDAGLYDEEIKMYEDWDLKLRIAKAHSFYYTGLEAVGYRDRPGGLSKAASEDHGYWKTFVFERNRMETCASDG